MKTQYTIHMQSRPVLVDSFPRLFLLASFSTLSPFNLKTHLIHARLPPAYTVLTFPVFLHISDTDTILGRFPLHLSCCANTRVYFLSSNSLLCSSHHVRQKKPYLPSSPTIPDADIPQLIILPVDQKDPYCVLINTEWVLHAPRKQTLRTVL